MKKPMTLEPPGVDEVDAQPEVEGRGQPVGQTPRLDQRAEACCDSGVLAVGERVLVGDGERPAVAVHRERGDLGGLVRAERAGVDEGEMGDVEEVVRQETRRAAGPQGRQPALEEGRVLGLGNGAERRERWLGGEEDDAVGLGDGGGRREPGGRGQRRPFPQAPGSRRSAPSASKRHPW